MTKENSFLRARFEELKTEHPKLDILDFLRRCRVEYLLNTDLLKLVDEIALYRIKKQIRDKIPETPLGPELENNFDQSEYIKQIEKFGNAILSRLEDPGLKNLIELFRKDDNIVREIGNCVLKTEYQYFVNLAKTIGIDVDLLTFIVDTPFIPAYRELSILDPEELYNVRNRRCLVCGRLINLGVYKRRKLFLFCKLCRTRIHVDQFRCHNCGNPDSYQLCFYMLEGQPELKLEYCKVCKTYFKTADEDKIGNVDDPLLLDIATLDYDSLAQEKGLSSSNTETEEHKPS